MNPIVKRVSDAILNTPNASDYPELVAKNAIRALRGKLTPEVLDLLADNLVTDEEEAFWNEVVDELLK